MATEAVVLALVEVAKLSLAAYFQAMGAAGKTPEEIDTMFTTEFQQFQENKPSDLPDV